MMVPALLLTGSYLAAALAVWGVLLRLTRAQAPGDVARLGLVALATGPIALAWVLAQSMRLLPGIGAGTLAWMVPVIVLLPLLATWRQTAAAAAELWRLGMGRSHAWALGFLVLLGALLGLCTAVFPLVDNDPLEYATAARLIFEGRSMNLYPFVNSQVSNGFYGPWTHPAGYPALMVWSDIIQGGAADIGLIRFPAYYATCVTMLLLLGLGGRLGGTFAALVLVSTPIYFLATIGAFVDPVRVAAGFAALVATEMASRLGLDLRRALACGALVGLGFFVHSIGITLFPMVAMLMLLYGPARFGKRLVAIFVVVAAGCAVVLPDLIANVRNLGAIVADATAIWSVPEVRFQEHMRTTRGIATFGDQVTNGVLQGLSGTMLYGLTYWLWLVLAAGYGLPRLRRFRRPVSAAFQSFHEAPPEKRWMVISFGTVLMWGLMAFGALLVGSVEFVKNVRYGQTVLPFVALFSGLAVARSLVAWRNELTWQTLRRASVVAGIALVALAGSLAVTAYHVAHLIVRYPMGPGWLHLSNREMLAVSRWPTLHVARQLDDLLKDGGCALLFRQADYGYYGARCFRSYHDHRLIDLYLARSPEEIGAVLKQNDIRAVMVPRYGLPEISNTGVEAFLGDPRRARLIWSMDGYRVYRIVQVPAPVTLMPIARMGGNLHFRDGSGRRATALGESGAALTTGEGDISVPPGFTRRWAESHACAGPVRNPVLGQLSATLAGNGHVVLELVDYASEKRDSQRTRMPVPVWEGVLHGRRQVSTQFLYEPGQCAAQRVRITLLSQGRVAIEDFAISGIEVSGADQEFFAAHLAESAGWSSFSQRYYSRAWEWGWSVGKNALFQRIPRQLPLRQVALASPPVFVGTGTPTRAIVVETDFTANAQTDLYLERLLHRGTRSTCRGLHDPARLFANLQAALASLPGIYRKLPDDAGSFTFNAGGAAGDCYSPLERIPLRKTGNAGGAARYEAAHDGSEAVRIVFMQRRDGAAAGAQSELVLRRLRVAGVAHDGSARVLYELRPHAGKPALKR